MALIEQLIAKCNSIAARMALYASRATRASEDGDRSSAKHWTQRREQDEARLSAAKHELARAYRVDDLRVHPSEARPPARPWGQPSDAELEAFVHHIDAQVRRAEVHADWRGQDRRFAALLASIEADLPLAYRLPVYDAREVDAVYTEHGGEG